MSKKIWNMKAVLAWAFALLVDGVQAKFVPCVKPGTKVLATTTCEWCGTEDKLFVFVSRDRQHYLGVCKECRKHEVRPADASPPAPHHAQCHCGQDLPKGRKEWCYGCRPKHRKPIAVQNSDGSGSIHGATVGLGI